MFALKYYDKDNFKDKVDVAVEGQVAFTLDTGIRREGDIGYKEVSDDIEEVNYKDVTTAEANVRNVASKEIDGASDTSLLDTSSSSLGDIQGTQTHDAPQLSSHDEALDDL